MVPNYILHSNRHVRAATETKLRQKRMVSGFFVALIDSGNMFEHLWQRWSQRVPHGTRSLDVMDCSGDDRVNPLMVRLCCSQLRDRGSEVRTHSPVPVLRVGRHGYRGGELVGPLRAPDP